MRRLVLLVASVVAAASFLMIREAGSSPAPASTTQPDQPQVTVSAADELAEAQRAAAAAVASTGAVVKAGMFSRGDVIATFTTPEFADQLTSATTSQVNEFLLGLSEAGAQTVGVKVVEAPVSATAEMVADGRVRVEVWSVLVVSAPGGTSPREAWRTTVLDMVRVDGRWLVDGWESAQGDRKSVV